MMHMQSCAGNPSRIPVTLCCKTVGHSSLKINDFIAHIRARGVNRIADVRSTPYSRYAPQFNRETLAADLQLADIAYEYLGSSLGGRPRRPDVLFPGGTVDFDKVRELPAFQEGILIQPLASGHALQGFAVAAIAGFFGFGIGYEQPHVRAHEVFQRVDLLGIAVGNQQHAAPVSGQRFMRLDMAFAFKALHDIGRTDENVRLN